MKSIKLIFICSSTILLFVSCETSNSSDSKDSKTNRNYIKECEKGFTSIQKGDIVRKEYIDTTIKVVHDTLDNIKVCSESGRAYLK